MKIRYLILLAVLAYGVGLVVSLPASTALAWAPPVPLTGVEGRLLAGRAAGFQLTPEHLLEDIQWRLAPAALLTGQLGANLEFGYLDGRGTGRVSVDWQRRLHLGDARLRLSAARLGAALDIPLAEFEGELEARVESATWQGGQMGDVRGRLFWRQAQLRQPLQLQLGEIEAVLSRDDRGYVARVSNSGGAISIEGELRLLDRRLQTDLRLRPLAGAPADLAETLGSIARRQSDGSYRIQRTSNLNQLL